MSDPAIKLTTKEIDAITQRGSDGQYPDVMTTQEVWEMLQISRSTLFEWKSEDRFKGAFRLVKGTLRWSRARVLDCYFNKIQD